MSWIETIGSRHLRVLKLYYLAKANPTITTQQNVNKSFGPKDDYHWPSLI